MFIFQSTFSREEQKANANESITFTDCGIFMLSSKLHPLNADKPISVTSFGILISFKLTQFEKHISPIDVTVSGNSMADNLTQSEKHSLLNFSTPYCILTYSRFSQLLKAEVSIYFTVFGKITFLNFPSANADSPIRTTFRFSI